MNGPPILRCALDMPTVATLPPGACDGLKDVSFMQPAPVNILQATAPVPVGPSDGPTRPPQAIAAVEGLPRGLLPHPTHSTLPSAQPVSDDVLNRCEALGFHTSTTFHDPMGSTLGMNLCNRGAHRLLTE